MLCIALLYLQHNTILLTYLQYITLLLLSLLLLLLFLMLLLSYKRHLQYIKNLFTILGITLLTIRNNDLHITLLQELQYNVIT